MKRRYHMGHVMGAAVFGTLVGITSLLPVTNMTTQKESEEPVKRYHVRTSGGNFRVSEFDDKYKVDSPWTYGGFEDFTDIGKDGSIDTPLPARELNRHESIYGEILERLQIQKMKEGNKNLTE